MAVAHCRLCGAQHAACGPAAAAIGVDQNILEVTTVGELRPYAVTIAGTATILNLTESEAERLGGRPVAEPDTALVEPPPAKARMAPPNKARTAPHTK